MIGERAEMFPCRLGQRDLHGCWLPRKNFRLRAGVHGRQRSPERRNLGDSGGDGRVGRHGLSCHYAGRPVRRLIAVRQRLFGISPD
jgi:hypothetical protein